jgi:hypothetical protein
MIMSKVSRFDFDLIERILVAYSAFSGRRIDGYEREDFINHYLKDKHMGNIFEAIWDDLYYPDSDEYVLGEAITRLQSARLTGDKKKILQIYHSIKEVDFDNCSESLKEDYETEVSLCNDLLYS